MSITQPNFSPDQLFALDSLKVWLTLKMQQVFRMSGRAGTGKSFVVSYMLQNLSDFFSEANSSPKTVGVCTFTWKAAMVLQERGFPEACSIHSLFYTYDETSPADNPRFIPRSKEDVRASYFMIIVDEAGMVPGAIRRQIESIGIPVLYVGDHNQLPPISEEVGDDTYMENAEIKLTTPHRNSKDNPIIVIANKICEGEFVKYGKWGDGIYRLTQDEYFAHEEKLIKSADRIIVGKNATRTAMNRKKRKFLGRNIHRMPYANEQIMVYANINDRGLYNGMDCVVVDDMSDMPIIESLDRLATIIPLHLYAPITMETVDKVDVSESVFRYHMREEPFGTEVPEFAEVESAAELIQMLLDQEGVSHLTVSRIIKSRNRLLVTYRVEVDENGKIVFKQTSGHQKIKLYFDGVTRLPFDPDADNYSARKAAFLKENSILQVDFNNSLTCHKAQGSGFNRLVVLTEWISRDKNFMRRWNYTAVTRAIDKLIWVS